MFDGMPHWAIKSDVAAICLIQFPEQTESNIPSLNTMCTTAGRKYPGLRKTSTCVYVSLSICIYASASNLFGVVIYLIQETNGASELFITQNLNEKNCIFIN